MRAFVTIISMLALAVWFYGSPEDRAVRLGSSSSWDKPPIEVYYEAELRRMKEQVLCYDLSFSNDSAYTLTLPDGRNFRVFNTDPIVIENTNMLDDSFAMLPVYQIVDSESESETETVDRSSEEYVCFTR